MQKILSKKQFEALPIEEQRIIIAKDVIAALDAGDMEAYTGSYVERFHYSSDIDPEADIKANFDKIGYCEVCALGACLLMATKYKNVLTFNDFENAIAANNKVWEVLAEVFPPEQLLLIEQCFEGYAGDADRATRIGSMCFGLDQSMYSDKKEAIDDFHNAYHDNNDRLRAIMNNIISNRGTFVI